MLVDVKRILLGQNIRVRFSQRETLKDFLIFSKFWSRGRWRYMYTVMVERGAYFDVKVSFVKSCENT